MSKRQYNIGYQHTHDIDWFFRIGKIVYHAASNGSLLPHKIKVADNIKIRQELVRTKIHINNIVTDNNYIVDRLKRNIAKLKDNDDSPKSSVDDYKRSFEEMAKKGFVSIDYVKDINKVPTYHVISRPNGIQQMPDNIFNLLPELNDGVNINIEQ